MYAQSQFYVFQTDKTARILHFGDFQLFRAATFLLHIIFPSRFVLPSRASPGTNTLVRRTRFAYVRTCYCQSSGFGSIGTECSKAKVQEILLLAVRPPTGGSRGPFFVSTTVPSLRTLPGEWFDRSPEDTHGDRSATYCQGFSFAIILRTIE